MRLHSPAPNPAAPPVSGGTVTDPGKIHNASVTGVHVALKGPAWVVLGESYDAGWRASCNGRSLGLPHVVDGYANGWLAPAGCTRVSFTFSPQSGVQKSYIASAIAIGLMLLLLLRGRVPSSGAGGDLLGGALAAGAPDPRRWPLPLALGLALLVSIPLAYLVRSTRRGGPVRSWSPSCCGAATVRASCRWPRPACWGSPSRSST